MRPRGVTEAGFSLVELLVAMTVSLIVTGAIYGLIASGQSAFRREPAMADRQQNIRMAMALIEQDIVSAGVGLPAFAQVFSASRPGAVCDTAGEVTGCLNGAGPEGSLGTAAKADRGAGDQSTASDVLETIGGDERCPTEIVCSITTPPGTAGDFQTREPLPVCLGVPGLVMITDNQSFRIHPADAGPPTACAGTPVGDAAVNGSLSLTGALAPWTAGALTTVTASTNANSPGDVFLYGARIARYRIGPSYETAELANEPALWRSGTGIYDAAGAAALEPGDASFPSDPSPWQLVARGVEDLQLEYMYMDGAGTISWTNAPKTVVLNDFSTVVRQVRVTLSARAVAGNLQFETKAGAGSTARNAVRGQLTRAVAPRASLMGLQMNGQLQ